MLLRAKFEVFGVPAPQGSKKYVGRSKTGRGIMVESSKKVAPWRDSVVAAFHNAYDIHEWDTVTEPVLLRVTFTLQRPASHYRSGKNAHLLKDSAPEFPGKYPDLSKLIRSTEDGMTTAGVYADDALIVSISAHKVYTGSINALPVPGAKIEIHSLDS